MGLNGSRPSEARDRVLAQLPAERQVEIMQRAEKRGPRPDDPDWLLVETMIEAASMIKDASAEAVASIQAAAVDAEVIVRLDRIESKLKGKPFVEPPAMGKALVAQAEVDTATANPLLRDLLAVLLAVLGMTALAVATAGFAQPVASIATFGLGVGVTLCYLWAAPIVVAAVTRHR